MYYLGFLAQDPKRVVIFKSLKTPKKDDFKYFTSVSGPYETEVMARYTLKQMKQQYGYKENPCECAKVNPAVSERQRRFMCSELGRKRAGKKTRTSMTERQLKDFCVKKNPESASPTQTKLNFIRRVGAKVYGKAQLSSILKALNTKEDIEAAYKALKGKVLVGKISVSQVRRGTEHELEHTTDRAIARKIAMDHLKEDPQYYTHLAKMEKQYKKNPFSGEKAVKLTKKLIRAYEAFRQENPGKSYHDQKFMSYMKELEKYAIGSVPYIGTLAKAYEHLESAKES